MKLPSFRSISSFNLPQNKFKAFVLIVVFLSLLGSITNFVPISALSCPLILLSPLFLSKNANLSQTSLSIISLWLLIFISTLIYAPQSFLDYQFYRRDGNFFISFAPLLSLSLLSFKIDVEKWGDFFIKWVSVALIPSIFYFLSSKPFSTIHNIFLFYFHGHNAAGGFLCFSTCLSLGFFLNKRQWQHLLITCWQIFATFLTASRGSILGLGMAMFTFFCVPRKYLKLYVLFWIIAHLLPLHYGYQFWKQHPNLSTRQIIEEALDETNMHVHRAGTAADRLFVLWPRAIDLWLKSPFLGTGFGSYNDMPYEFFGTENFFMLNKPKELKFDAGHAHHSFLHILAENGLLGLFLLIYCLYQIDKSTKSLPSKSLAYGLELALWANIFSSFTEHRIFTPSQMFPFNIMVGLCLCSRKFNKGNK